MDFINEKIKKFFEEDCLESDGKKPSQEEKQNVRDYFESGFDYRLNKCFDACKEARLIQSKISNNIFYFDSIAEGFLVIQCDSRTDGKTVGIIDGSKDFHEFLERVFFDNKIVENKTFCFFGGGKTQDENEEELKEATVILSRFNNLLKFYKGPKK